MQSFFSCFACGEKSSTVVTPQPVQISSNKIQNSNDITEQNNISIIQSIDGEKSKSATTITFRTTDTTISKMEDDQQYIQKKIQQMRKKDLPQRKAMQSQFIRQNLAKSKNIYLVEKQWSEQYTKFLKDPTMKSIRCIDNKNLLDSKGNLKNNIKQKQNYFIINERIWKFVHRMYGGGPDIVKDMYFPVYSLSLRKTQIIPGGLINPLNLCYMISVLQCLFSIQPLNYYFFKRQYAENQDTKKKPFHTIMYKLIKQVIQDPGKEQDIKEFASNFQNKFNPYQQHDAQQFFLYLSNILQQQMKIELNGPKQFKDAQSAYYFYMNSNRSIIDKVFSGQIMSRVICGKCDYESDTYLPFIDIPLEITDSTLQGCLKKHFSQQNLQDLYECQKCKKKAKPQKQLIITKTPNFLMIVMKKFTQSGRKIQDRIKYPQQLDIRKFCYGHHGQTKFSLQSIIVHKGAKSNKGHYYCYTKRIKKDWYYCNDETVKKIQSSESLGRDAYILVYERIK